jgi:hypothetical protein
MPRKSGPSDRGKAAECREKAAGATVEERPNAAKKRLERPWKSGASAPRKQAKDQPGFSPRGRYSAFHGH